MISQYAETIATTGIIQKMEHVVSFETLESSTPGENLAPG